MNIWNKVFLVLIFLLAIAVVFFTSQEMKIRKEGEQTIANLEKKIADAERQWNDVLQGSAPEKPRSGKAIDEMGLNEMILKLQDLIFERGNAWFGCQPGNISVQGKGLTPQQLGGDNPATSPDRLKTIQLVEVKLTITGPIVEVDGKEEVIPPEDLKGLVYLFDEGQEGAGGSFLGRFTVSGVQKVQTGYQATLVAANEMNESEIQQIQRSGRSTWAVYATAPKDRYAGIFDRLTPDEVETLLPAARRAQLTNPERPLLDFDELLTRLYQWRIVLQQDIDRAKRDIQTLEAGLATAADEEKNLQNDIQFEQKRIQAMKDQAEAVRKKVDEYDEMIKTMAEQIDKTQKQNEWYVAKIAEYQLKVKDLIEEKAEQAANP